MVDRFANDVVKQLHEFLRQHPRFHAKMAILEFMALRDCVSAVVQAFPLGVQARALAYLKQPAVVAARERRLRDQLSAKYMWRLNNTQERYPHILADWDMDLHQELFMLWHDEHRLRE